MSVEQLSLDSAPVVPRVPPRPLTVEERYERWIAANPHVIGAVADTARQLRGQGRRVSINRCFEEMRERIHTVGDEYVLNNSFRPLVARAVMDRFEDLAGVFETRRRKGGR